MIQDVHPGSRNTDQQYRRKHPPPSILSYLIPIPSRKSSRRSNILVIWEKMRTRCPCARSCFSILSRRVSFPHALVIAPISKRPLGARGASSAGPGAKGNFVFYYLIITILTEGGSVQVLLSQQIIKRYRYGIQCSVSRSILGPPGSRSIGRRYESGSFYHPGIIKQ
jgi:hypothetical protein